MVPESVEGDEEKIEKRKAGKPMDIYLSICKYPHGLQICISAFLGSPPVKSGGFP